MTLQAGTRLILHVSVLVTVSMHFQGQTLVMNFDLSVYQTIYITKPQQKHNRQHEEKFIMMDLGSEQEQLGSKNIKVAKQPPKNAY